MECPECHGKGKKTDPDWEQFLDRMMDSGNYPDYDRASRQASRHYSQYRECIACKGTGEASDSK